MPRKRKQRWDDSGDDQAEFVPAVFARSMEEAEDYRQLLDDYDIPAIIGIDDDEPSGRPRGGQGPMTRGVPVLVPQAMLEEASEVIAARDNADEFGLALEDTDEEEEDEDYLVDGDVEGHLEASPDDEEEDEEEEEDLFGDDDRPDDEEEDEPG
jgi:hypothetical protein